MTAQRPLNWNGNRLTGYVWTRARYWTVIRNFSTFWELTELTGTVTYYFLLQLPIMDAWSPYLLVVGAYPHRQRALTHRNCPDLLFFITDFRSEVKKNIFMGYRAMDPRRVALCHGHASGLRRSLGFSKLKGSKSIFASPGLHAISSAERLQGPLLFSHDES